MKFRNHLLFLILALFFVSCVSVPDTINEKYLQDMTEEEAAKIDNLTTNIIAKRKEKKETEEIFNKAETEYNNQTAQLGILEKELEVLIEKEELYKAQGNMPKLSETTQKRKEKEKEISEQKIIVKYLEADKDYKEAVFNTKTAELGVLVSELELEKAKIAKRNKTEMDKEEGKPEAEEDKGGFFSFFKSKPKDEIDLEKYTKYYEDQKSFLKSSLEKQEKAESALNEIKPQYDKIIENREEGDSNEK